MATTVAPAPLNMDQANQPNPTAAPTNADLCQKSKKVAEKISENMHIIANEPSLALYRLQEHVRKSLPQLVDKRIEVNRIHQDLQGKCYDAEYAVNAVKSLQKSGARFHNIHDLLKNAIFFKQQLTYEENHRADRKSQASMYQRLSSLSLDLADLPAALRPVASVLTASKVEYQFCTPSQYNQTADQTSSDD
ncbi:hypothetical protein CHUAL_001406 [Chamberlinius hualienensis]